MGYEILEAGNAAFQAAQGNNLRLLKVEVHVLHNVLPLAKSLVLCNLNK